MDNNNIFDVIQDAVYVAGREMKEVASDISDRAKLRYEISTRESYLKELYTELGKKYYAEHKDDERTEDDKLPGGFEEIDTLLKELTELRGELADRRGAKHCARCGAQVAVDSDYCGKCGAYMHEE